MSNPCWERGGRDGYLLPTGEVGFMVLTTGGEGGLHVYSPLGGESGFHVYSPLGEGVGSMFTPHWGRVGCMFTPCWGRGLVAWLLPARREGR